MSMGLLPECGLAMWATIHGKVTLRTYGLCSQPLHKLTYWHNLATHILKRHYASNQWPPLHQQTLAKYFKKYFFWKRPPLQTSETKIKTLLIHSYRKLERWPERSTQYIYIRITCGIQSETYPNSRTRYDVEFVCAITWIMVPLNNIVVAVCCRCGWRCHWCDC